ncbi:DUF7151 family protein [Wenyingzhuangia sp. IMCC45574]
MKKIITLLMVSLMISCAIELPANMENRLIIPQRFHAGQGGDKCPQGGIKFTTGIDANQNGELEEGEIDKIQYFCSGEPIPTDLLSSATGEPE